MYSISIKLGHMIWNVTLLHFATYLFIYLFICGLLNDALSNSQTT